MRNHIKLADIYCRLSDEEKKHKNESESITNQRAIIRDYCEKHDIIIVKEFVDDAIPAAILSAPAFKRRWIIFRPERPIWSLQKTFPVLAVT